MVHFSTKSIRLPGRNAVLHTLTGRVIDGHGIGSVLLDNGMGGQSSYHGIDDYINTSHSNPFVGQRVRNQPKMLEGQGLADKIQSSLSRLNISTPRNHVMMKPTGGNFDAPKPVKRKNIVMSM